MSMQGWLSGSQSEAWLAQLERIEWKENEILLLLAASASQAALQGRRLRRVVFSARRLTGRRKPLQ